MDHDGRMAPGSANALSTSKRLFFLVAAAILSLAAFAPSVAASPRTGDLHITKECGDYHGLAAQCCTFVSSDIKAIEPHDRIYYASAIVGATLDTDVTIVAG